uniref:Uncharacterized protein n=1 Tax=Apteryx owenii TaxID=8824 RepID=A0A8B9PUB3_APTOW
MRDRLITHPLARPSPSAVISSPPPFCPCSPWRPARPGSPWRCGWPRCWGPRRAGSPARSAGTRGPASRRSRLPPAGRWTGVENRLVHGSGCASPLSGTGQVHSLSSSLPSPPVAAIPASAAEAAAALLASSSCRCLCSSMETLPGPRLDPHQTQSRWPRGPAWHHPPQPKWGS